MHTTFKNKCLISLQSEGAGVKSLIDPLKKKKTKQCQSELIVCKKRVSPKNLNKLEWIKIVFSPKLFPTESLISFGSPFPHTQRKSKLYRLSFWTAWERFERFQNRLSNFPYQYLGILYILERKNEITDS